MSLLVRLNGRFSLVKRKMFVANRITEIQKLSEPDQWRYVNTKENPAISQLVVLYPQTCIQMTFGGTVRRF